MDINAYLFSKVLSRMKLCQVEKNEVQNAIKWVLQCTQAGVKFPKCFMLVGTRVPISICVKKKKGYYAFLYAELEKCTLGKKFFPIRVKPAFKVNVNALSWFINNLFTLLLLMIINYFFQVHNLIQRFKTRYF